MVDNDEGGFDTNADRGKKYVTASKSSSAAVQTIVIIVMTAMMMMVLRVMLEHQKISFSPLPIKQQPCVDGNWW